MQKITPHIWFDKEAKEAAVFYTSLFKNSAIKNTTTLSNTPSGTVDLVTVDLLGQEFSLLSAGPYFKINPSISFLVACKTKEEVDTLFASLSQGGMALMGLGTYPFSERYAWVQDKYGVSWQLMYMGDRTITHSIIPTLMFVGDQCGNAEKAIDLYTSVFSPSTKEHVMRYTEGEGADKPGTIKHAGFLLDGQSFAAMDSAGPHAFSFNEAISLVVHCDTQQEIDYFWEKLSADPKAEQCGWIKDAFGVSWQIVPVLMDKMMKEGTKEQIDRVTQAFLKMKKFDLATLQAVYDQE